MLPAGPLMIEHRLIERMITVLDHHRKAVEAGSPPDLELLDKAVDFMSNYADRCHHGKEEDLLFSKLRTKPMTPEMVEAMDRLIADHVRSRTLIGQLRELNEQGRGGAADASGIGRVLAELVSIYPDHIFREDKQFFPQAMRYLDRQESDALIAQFNDFDRKLYHERYSAIVKGAERR